MRRVCVWCNLIGWAIIIYFRFTSDFPGFYPVLLFWIVLLSAWVTRIPEMREVIPLWIFVLVGLSLNATVTLANGGWMPVVGMKEKANGIWRPATQQDRLLFLADDTAQLGFSLGDFILIGFATSSEIMMRKKKREQNKVPITVSWEQLEPLEPQAKSQPRPSTNIHDVADRFTKGYL